MEYIEVNIPFQGFYNSRISNWLDFIGENIIEDETDWETIHEEISKLYCKWLEEILNNYLKEINLSIKIRYTILLSPKYYNYETDRIFADIPKDNLIAIKEYIFTENRLHYKFIQTCKNWFTSKDGYMSFYNPDYETWGDIEKWDHNQLKVLIEVLLIDLYAKYRGEYYELGYSLTEIFLEVNMNKIQLILETNAKYIEEKEEEE